MRTLAWPSASNPQSLKLCGRQPLKRFERVVQAAVNSGQPFKKKNPTSRPQQSLSPFDRRSALPMGSGEGFSFLWPGPQPIPSRYTPPKQVHQRLGPRQASQPPLIFRLEQYSQIKCLHDQQDNTTDGPPLARTMSPHLRPVMSFVSPFFAFQLCFPSMI